jgi:hypothetical protein
MQANSLMAPLYNYQPAHDQQQLATIMGVFRQPLLGDLAGRERQAAATNSLPELMPIFIVGLPRSGSTLIETVSGMLPLF